MSSRNGTLLLVAEGSGTRPWALWWPAEAWERLSPAERWDVIRRQACLMGDVALGGNVLETLIDQGNGGLYVY